MKKIKIFDRRGVKMIKKNCLMCALVIALITVVIISAIVVSAQTKPIISADTVAASSGSDVIVPMRISNNTGICAAKITVEFDEELTLTGVSSGNALSGLTFTKPGNMEENTVNLGWDGVEADNTNGIIANLTFKAPQKDGIYDINISYLDGDIVDGNLNPVDMVINNGQVIVGSSKEVTVEIAGKTIKMNGENNSSGQIMVALYSEKGYLISLGKHNITSTPIKVTDTKNSSYAKVLWWDGVKPVCPSQTVYVK